VVVDELCVGDDTSGVGGASVSINEENGVRQTNPVTRCVVASARVDRIGNSWESGELYFYIWWGSERTCGTDTGEHADRTTTLAGVTLSSSLSVLAGAANGLGVGDDWIGVSNVGAWYKRTNPSRLMMRGSQYLECGHVSLVPRSSCMECEREWVLKTENTELLAKEEQGQMAIVIIATIT